MAEKLELIKFVVGDGKEWLAKSRVVTITDKLEEATLFASEDAANKALSGSITVKNHFEMRNSKPGVYKASIKFTKVVTKKEKEVKKEVSETKTKKKTTSTKKSTKSTKVDKE